jgi:hypothetical protein
MLVGMIDTDALTRSASEARAATVGKTVADVRSVFNGRRNGHDIVLTFTDGTTVSIAGIHDEDVVATI